MSSRIELQYISSTLPKHSLDLYNPSTKTLSNCLLVYVHGGAWKTGDKTQFIQLGNKLSQELQLPVVVPNYPLSIKEVDMKEGTEVTPIQHPVHSYSILSSLDYLIHSNTLREILHLNSNEEIEFILMGHSAGAQIIGYLLSLMSQSMISRVKGVIGIEGIYDIPFMVSKWPTYEDWFVVNAFGKEEWKWKEASPIHRNRGKSGLPPHLILHSQNDELLDVEQSFRYVEMLKESGNSVIWNDIDLKSTHDEVLMEDELVILLSQFLDSLNFIS